MSDVITRQDLMRILEACGIDHLSVDSNGYLKIDTGIIADSFNGLVLDVNTNNTSDTWVPVFKNDKIQHRVIPRIITNDLSIQTVSKQVTAPANGSVTVQIDISGVINGYSYVPIVCRSTNFNVVPINTAMEGSTTTLNLFFRNITAQSQTFTALGIILRWKSEQ